MDEISVHRLPERAQVKLDHSRHINFCHFVHHFQLIIPEELYLNMGLSGK